MNHVVPIRRLSLAVAFDPPALIPSLPEPPPSETPPALANAPQPPQAQEAPLSLHAVAQSPGSRAGIAAVDADSLPPGVLRQTTAKGLVDVTDLRVVPTDGTVFVLERSRGLSVMSPTRERTAVFAPKDLLSTDGAGMLGLALDPQFETRRQLYVFMTSSLGTMPANRVVRLTLDASLANVVARDDVLVGVPFSVASTTRAAEGRHLGGRMVFGPDGKLYVATGDGYLADAPQTPTALAGKVLRVDTATPAQPAGVALGVRNAVGIAFHPNHEGLMVADGGGGLLDELSVLRTGGNAGWDPRCIGTAFDYCGDASAGEKLVPMNAARATLPSWQSSKPGTGLSSMALLRGPHWRHWNGALALAFDNARRIDLVKLDHGNRVVKHATVVSDLGYGFSAIDQGPDGLYVATRGKSGGDEVVRLVLSY